MSIRTNLVAVVLTLITIPAVSDRPVAMIVETEPRGSVGDDTVMAITVQAAPEDRRRLGRDIWIQVELTRGGVRVDRLARPADLDDNGRATIEVAWPPGDYRLQVEIEGAGKGVTGAWLGKLTVPSGGASPAPDPPTPKPTPIPAVEAVSAAAPVTAAAASPIHSELPTPTSDSPAPIPEPQPDAPTVAPGSGAVIPGAAAAGASSPASQTESPTPSPEPEPDPPAVAPGSGAEISGAAAVGASSSASPTKPPPPRPEPRPPEPPPTRPTDDTTTDLTVMVTERNRPILGLQADSFSLRIGGKAVTIEEAVDASASPLNLGLAVSIASANPDQATEIAQLIARFAHRTSGGGGSTMLATAATAAPEWLPNVDRLIDALSETRPQTDSDLARMIATALSAFEQRRGRAALVVATDGESGTASADWKAVSAAADAAGVPIFVIGLRDTGYPSKARNALGRLADSTGGRSYFLGDAAMLQMTLDYIGELIDGSYALRFRDPPTGSGAPRTVKVEVGTRAWKVHAPGKIR